MSTKTQTNNYGTSFSSLLTITFIVLKLTGYISWSWLWVLAPSWIPLSLYIGLKLLIKYLNNLSKH